MNQYICDCCKETFDQGWDDEDALAEMERNFPGMDMSEMARTCDVCYINIMAYNGDAII